jgi:NhaB family Na+:H+ antiporter
VWNRSFLRSLLMHGCVGTALGGCATVVGEPQNLVIARYLNWDFKDFAVKMFPISGTVLPIGLWTCLMLEMLGIFDYGAKMPVHVRKVLKQFADDGE